MPAKANPLTASTPWATAQAICDMPEVDQCIRNLVDDQTGDNGTFMVRAVLDALTARHSKLADPVAWLPMETAPRDSSIIRLLVEFEDHSLEDSTDPVQTIGHNNLDNTNVDEWQFAGWCWTQDCYTQGTGKPIGWAPFTAPLALKSALPFKQQHGVTDPLTIINCVIGWLEGGADPRLAASELRLLASRFPTLRPDIRPSTLDVIAERTRQIVDLGRDAEHDDTTSDAGDLACAAAAYALNAGCQLNPHMQAQLTEDGDLPDMWPAGWSGAHWRPKDPRRDLVRAGALVLAEIDRIDRAAAKGRPA